LHKRLLRCSFSSNVKELGDIIYCQQAVARMIGK
jgi:hypothetical protein